MKDLLLYVADADAMAFMKSILNKPQALEVHPIDFDIERHPQRDSGMVQSGAELTRMKKGKYQKALLMWDHHGSGRDHKQSPVEVQNEIQGKLDSFSWKDNSSVTILVPELEQWLWHCENTLLAHCRLTDAQLQTWLEERARKLNISVADQKTDQPKELFEYVMKNRLRRTISPRDFEEMGKQADVNGLMKCETFSSIVEVLRIWFPR